MFQNAESTPTIRVSCVFELKRKRSAVFIIFTATCFNPYSSDFSGSLVIEV